MSTSRSEIVTIPFRFWLRYLLFRRRKWTMSSQDSTIHEWNWRLCERSHAYVTRKLSKRLVNTPWNHAITYTYIAHRSMMEMEHSDWYLSGPYFPVRTAQMDRSRHALFFFGLIVSNCVTSSKKVFVLRKNRVKWKKKLVQAEIGAKKYVLGLQRKSTSNERETEFASPELNY